MNDEPSPTKYEPPDLDELAKAVAFKTNLSEHVCRELLLNGWTFTQELGKLDRWEQRGF